VHRRSSPLQVDDWSSSGRASSSWLTWCVGRDVRGNQKSSALGSRPRRARPLGSQTIQGGHLLLPRGLAERRRDGRRCDTRRRRWCARRHGAAAAAAAAAAARAQVCARPRAERQQRVRAAPDGRGSDRSAGRLIAGASAGALACLCLCLLRTRDSRAFVSSARACDPAAAMAIRAPLARPLGSSMQCRRDACECDRLDAADDPACAYLFIDIDYRACCRDREHISTPCLLTH
jgi:hypothetical protein